MRTLLILTSLFITSICFPQNPGIGKAIIIHPSVGKVIDNTEKKTYNLYPEYSDSTYNSSFVLKYNDTTFSVVVVNIKNQSIEKSISSAELDKMYYQIDEISLKEKPVYNEEKKKRKRSGPNYSYNTYYLTEALVQLTITTINVLLILAN